MSVFSIGANVCGLAYVPPFKNQIINLGSYCGITPNRLLSAVKFQSTMFKIGDEVVCIDDSHQTHPTLKKGEKYIIRGFRKLTGGLYLVGIKLPNATDGEIGHNQNRFQKVDWVDELLRKLMSEVQADELVSA